MAEWREKRGPSIYHLQQTYLNPKDTHRPKVKGWRVTMQMGTKGGWTHIGQNRLQNNYCNKIYITVMNIYVAKLRAPNSIKQLLRYKGMRKSNVIIVGTVTPTYINR